MYISLGNEQYNCTQEVPLLKLPTEIIANILFYMPGEEVSRSQRISKQFHLISSHPQIWDYLLKRDFPFRTSTHTEAIDSYRESFKIESNWTKKRYKNIELEKPDSTIISIRKEKLICVGNNGDIHIINKESGKLEITLERFERHISIRDAHLINNTLILFSCEDVNEIEVWNLSDRSCIGFFDTNELYNFDQERLYAVVPDEESGTSRLTAYRFTDGSLCYTIDDPYITSILLVENNQLIYSCVDYSIKIRDSITGKLIKEIKIDSKDPVVDVYSYDNTIISSHSNGMINIWDKEQGKIVNTIQDKSNNKYELTFSRNIAHLLLTFNKLDTKWVIDAWNKNNGDPIYSFKDITSYSMGMNNKIALYSNNEFKIINILTAKSLCSWKIELKDNDKVYHLELDHDRLFAETNNKIIHIWDSKTGNLIATYPGYDLYLSDDRMMFKNLEGQLQILNFK